MISPLLWRVHNASTGDDETLSERQIRDLFRACFHWQNLTPWETQDARTQQAFISFMQSTEDPEQEDNPEEKETNMPNWPATYDRAAVRGAIEEATGEGLSVDDPLPDTLIAAAQSLGISALDLRMWIHDRPKWSWSPRALAHWARQRGLAPADAPDPPEAPICGHCGERTADPEHHQCNQPSRAPAIHLDIDLTPIRPEDRGPIWEKLAELLNAVAAARKGSHT